jgi:hypothetical protein
MFAEMFEHWKIKRDSTHIFVRDNTSNMIKAMEDGGHLDGGCFVHTLQFIVNDVALSQRSAKDRLAICYCIVDILSVLAGKYTKFKEIQMNLGIPEHHLKQDVSSRWNSTSYMLKSVQKQKMVIAANTTEHDIPQLTANKLYLIK